MPNHAASVFTEPGLWNETIRIFAALVLSVVKLLERRFLGKHSGEDADVKKRE